MIVLDGGWWELGMLMFDLSRGVPLVAAFDVDYQYRRDFLASSQYREQFARFEAIEREVVRDEGAVRDAIFPGEALDRLPSVNWQGALDFWRFDKPRYIGEILRMLRQQRCVRRDGIMVIYTIVEQASRTTILFASVNAVGVPFPDPLSRMVAAEMR